jgi:hypothetical protein
LHFHNGNSIKIRKSACELGFLSYLAIGNGRNLQSLKRPAQIEHMLMSKAKAEPLLALPFREKRVKCVTKNGV